MDARNRRIWTLFWSMTLALASFALSRASLELVNGDTGMATIWPLAGLGLAALVLAPRSRWLAFALAIFAGCLGAQLFMGGSVAVALAISVCAAAQAVAAALVMTRLVRGPRPRVGSMDTVGALVVAGVGVTAVFALPGAAVLQLAGSAESSLGPTWFAWWMANAVGVLVVTPALLAFLEPGQDRAGSWETAGLVALTGLVTLLFFWHQPGDGPVLLRYTYPILPLLLWCAVRIGARATTFASAIVATVASLATSRGLGPFAQANLDAHQRVEVLQGYLAMAVLSTLLVGAVVADQRRARALARRDADRLASVLNASSEVSIIGADLDGRITVFSPGAELLTGRTAAELLGRTGKELHDPHELAVRARELGVEPGMDVFTHAVRHGGSDRRDWTYVHVDGSRRRVSLTMTGQHDDAGNLIGFLAIATDVTARRAAEQALAASEERHRLTLSSLPDMQIYLLDSELRGVLAEGPGIPSALRETPFLGRPVSELIAPDQYAVLEPLCRAALAGAQDGRMDYVSSRTGLLHDVQAVPYRADDGEIDGVLLVMRDITERDAQMRALRRAEADLRTVFDQAPIGHAILGEDGALLEGNAALEAITGYETDLVREFGAAEFVHPDDLPALRALLAAINAGGARTGELEIRVRHRDGHTVDVALHAAALSSAGHEHPRTLVQVVDVTHRKRLEEQLRALADRDPMSGLLNRRRFDEELDAHLERCRRYGSDGAVIVLDVDDFKHVNDTRGHHAGDELIVGVADLLRERLRSSDVIARLGGDEFGVLLPRATRDTATLVAEALVDGVRDRLGVTISLGIAMVANGGCSSGDQLMIAADRAMYDVKAAGRDGHAFFMPA
jgi:diguanylate cyclase (GGDEF)-like protein/PAS domain S-box-containing protein